MKNLDLDGKLLDFNFNQDASCFACSTNSGFKVYSCEPFRLKVRIPHNESTKYSKQFSREFKTGGIGLVHMLFRCNILALVGGGHTPRFPPTNVTLPTISTHNEPTSGHDVGRRTAKMFCCPTA